MVLRPRCAQPRPWAVQHLVRTRPQNAGCIGLDVLGLVAAHPPAARHGPTRPGPAGTSPSRHGSRRARDGGRRCRPGSPGATLGATGRRSVRATTPPARPARPTWPGSPTLVLRRPGPRGRRRPEAVRARGGGTRRPRCGSVPAEHQTRPVPLCAGRRRRDRSWRSRARPSRNDGRRRDACRDYGLRAVTSSGRSRSSRRFWRRTRSSQRPNLAPTCGIRATSTKPRRS